MFGDSLPTYIASLRSRKKQETLYIIKFLINYPTLIIGENRKTFNSYQAKNHQWYKVLVSNTKPTIEPYLERRVNTFNDCCERLSLGD